MTDEDDTIEIVSCPECRAVMRHDDDDWVCAECGYTAPVQS